MGPRHPLIVTAEKSDGRVAGQIGSKFSTELCVQTVISKPSGPSNARKCSLPVSATVSLWRLISITDQAACAAGLSRIKVCPVESTKPTNQSGMTGLIAVVHRFWPNDKDMRLSRTSRGGQFWDACPIQSDLSLSGSPHHRIVRKPAAADGARRPRKALRFLRQPLLLLRQMQRQFLHSRRVARRLIHSNRGRLSGQPKLRDSNS